MKCQPLCAVFLMAVLVGCNHQNPQDLKEKTARTTANLKRDAKAVVEGVREGWSSDQSVNLNTATKKQLLTLPGVTSAEADRVIAGRPYSEPDDVVTKHILPKAEYDKIADRVTTK